MAGWWGGGSRNGVLTGCTGRPPPFYLLKAMGSVVAALDSGASVISINTAMGRDIGARISPSTASTSSVAVLILQGAGNEEWGSHPKRANRA